MSPVKAFTLGTLCLTCAAPDADAQRAPITRVSQVTVQQRLIIRVPRLPVGRAPLASTAPLPPIRWVKRRPTSACQC